MNCICPAIGHLQDIIYYSGCMNPCYALLAFPEVLIAKDRTPAGHTLFVVVGIIACYELFWS